MASEVNGAKTSLEGQAAKLLARYRNERAKRQNASLDITATVLGLQRFTKFVPEWLARQLLTFILVPYALGHRSRISSILITGYEQAAAEYRDVEADIASWRQLPSEAPQVADYVSPDGPKLEEIVSARVVTLKAISNYAAGIRELWSYLYAAPFPRQTIPTETETNATNRIS